MRNRKRTTGLYLFIGLNMLLTGCGEGSIRPASSEDGVFATVNAETTLEYSLYTGKQVTVFANQIMSLIGLIRNADDAEYELLKESMAESIRLMREASDEYATVTPPETDLAERDAVIRAMELCIAHCESCQDSLSDGESVSGYADILQNDYYALTALASTYTQ